MSDSRAAIRYAKAILDLAIENGRSDIVDSDIRSITDTIAESSDLREMLASPIIKPSSKKQALLEIFTGIDKLTEGAISMLVDNKRVSMLNEVALKYIILNEQLKGKDVAMVTTAVPMTADLEQKVLAQVTKLTGNTVTLNNNVDKSIIGGFVLRVGDLQYDASIANKLSNLKREFTNSL